MTHSVGTLLKRIRPIATSVIVTLGLLVGFGNNWAAVGDSPPRGGDLSCVSWGPNRLDCFIRGTDGQLNHKWYTGAGWQGWRSYNGLIASDPTCVSWGVNRIDCVARGTDNAMYHTWWNGDQWRVWENIGGVFASANPACMSWGPKRLDCFARGDNGQMYHNWLDGSRWGGWEALGGVFGAGDPTCVSWEAHRLDCFARGDDNALYHKWWDGSRWRGWESLGGTLLTKPACVAWGVGRLECFTKGTDGAMWHRRFDRGRWQNWESLGGIITTDPACVSWGQNRIDCVARGTDNTLYHRWWDGAQWMGWEAMGGVILSNPACTSWGPNHLDCFAWGNEGIVHNAWNEPAAPQRWGGWVVLGKDVASRPSQQQLDGERGWLTTTTVGNTTTYRIDEPNVKAKLTNYPEVTFAPGDRVTIVAGGCAQSGGIGDTWHRYVQSSDLYYGTILIPGIAGAIAGIDAAPPRLSEVTGAADGEPGPTFVLPGPGQGLQLSLGFADDNYPDNGYWGHDDGPGGQCRGIGNAYVIITKTPGPVPGPSDAYAPFDLVFNNPDEPYDDNGLLLNPVWGWQKTHNNTVPAIADNGVAKVEGCSGFPWASDCTTQKTAQDNTFLCRHPELIGESGVKEGHVNWAAATYEGPIVWEGRSAGWRGDDDYNMKLVPRNTAGLTNRNQIISLNGEQLRSFGLEFDSDETVDHMDGTWWDDFHKAVDASADVAGNMIDGQFAIVTGLLGLDCAHACHSELHPVWAIAIRERPNPAKGSPSDERWAIYVRRWGNEGFCSGNQHFLNAPTGNIYTFRLPWRPGATAVGIDYDLKTFKGLAKVSQSQWAHNEGVLVSFEVPIAKDPIDVGEMVYGEIILHWRNSFTAAALASPSSEVISNTSPRPQHVDKAEDRVAELIQGMDPAQREIFEARKPKKTVPSRLGLPIQPGVPLQQVEHLPTRPKQIDSSSIPSSHTTDVVDVEKRAKNQQLEDAIYAALPTLAPIAPSPTGSISGTVINADTKEPLVGQVIRVKSSEIIARTQSDGSFTLEGIPQGLQTVLFIITGFRDDVTRTVTVVSGQSVSVGTVEMPVRTFTGTLIGKVVVDNPAQNPIQGATVVVTMDATGASFQKSTDGDGNFIFSDVPAGFITITVSKPGFTSKTLPGQVKEDRTGNAGVIRLVPN